LATAIGAIVALWPSPDPEDSGRFVSVRVLPGIPLSEYHERFEGLVPQSAGTLRQPAQSGDPVRLAAHGLLRSTTGEPAPGEPTPDEPTPTPGTPDSTPTGTPTPDTPFPTSQTPGTPTPATPTPGTPTWDPEVLSTYDVLSPDVPVPIPSGMSREDTGKQADLVFTNVRAALPQLELPFEPMSLVPGPSTGSLFQIYVSTAVKADGSMLPPEEAAERLVELFGEIRTVGGLPSGKLEPLGVVVTADLELSGLRGEPVLLSWSIWQLGGEARLFGQWLATNPAYALEATSDKDTGSIDVWVPVPETPGPYIVRLDLTTEGARLASADSEAFE
jgi:hypothetical protein